MRKKSGPTHFRNAKIAQLAFCAVSLARGRHQPRNTTLFTMATCKPCRARIRRVWGKESPI